jgi:hypothetical protein
MRQKLDNIKEAIHQTDTITEDEKTLAVQKIEEWYVEDKAMELLPEQLMQITKQIRPILVEMGLL